MLTCYRVRRRLGAYLDGALDVPAAGLAGAHLARCARCRSEVDGLRRLRVVLRAAFEVPGPPEWAGFWPEIVRRIGDGRRPAARPRPWILARPRLAFGGALAALGLASLTLWQVFSTAPVPVAEPGVSVTSARTDHPGASVMVYTPPERDLAVVWVFGLDEAD